MKRYRVITEGRDKCGHHFAKGDIVEYLTDDLPAGLIEYRCIEGNRPGLKQVLNECDVEEIE